MVVSGCYATLNQQEVAETLGVDLVVNNTEKNKLVELANRQLGCANHACPCNRTRHGSIIPPWQATGLCQSPRRLPLSLYLLHRDSCPRAGNQPINY